MMTNDLTIHESGNFKVEGRGIFGFMNYNVLWLLNILSLRQLLVIYEKIMTN